jgi:hypothetical protein
MGKPIAPPDVTELRGSLWRENSGVVKNQLADFSDFSPRERELENDNAPVERTGA